MSLDQKRARWFGVLYLITFVTSIPALLLYEPVLDIPSATSRVLGTTSSLARRSAGAAAHHREHRHRGRDLPDRQTTERGTGARLRDGAAVECTFILVGIVCMLGIVTLRNQVAGPSEGTVAYTLAAIKDWTFLLGPGWVVGWGNGLILGYLMYRSGLVPRRARGSGSIGGPLIIVSGTAVMFTGNDPSSTLHSLQGLATIPEFPWELFLGIYCTIWGFRRDAPILSGSAG